MDFEAIWALLYEHGACARKMEGTKQFWETLTAEEQKHIFNTISTKLKEGKFVQFDPIRAIKENRPKQAGCQTLSFRDYYARFGTTEERDGWKRQYLPEKQTTIYIKN